MIVATTPQEVERMKNLYERCKKNGLKPKIGGLLEIIKTSRQHRRNTFMIGDTATDIRTAVNAGAQSIGVLWGYRDKRELIGAGADQIASSIEELTSLIESNVDEEKK